jgi:predicted Zn-dependent protease
MSRTCSERAARRLTRRSALALALLASLGLGCGTISVDQERQLGEQFAREIRREITLLNDEVVQGYVADIGRSIVEAAGPQPFPYQFYVVADPELNAFAAPAGHVYINTGILLNARNISEVAGVMAHEVGHVAKRHVAQNYNRQRNTGIAHQAAVLATSVLAPQWAGATNLVGGLSGMAYLNTFTRDAEREADAFAIEVMPRAGYDPIGLVTFFRTLQSQGSGAHVPAFLSSHPATDDRIISEAALPAGLHRDDGGRFEIIQYRVRVRTGDTGGAPGVP